MENYFVQIKKKNTWSLVNIERPLIICIEKSMCTGIWRWHSRTKKGIVSFRELGSIIFDRFWAADYESVLEIFPARQFLW
jgi:hypothetical protein